MEHWNVTVNAGTPNVIKQTLDLKGEQPPI